MEVKAVDASQFSKRVYLDPKEQGCVALVLGFPHLSALAKTLEMALRELTVLIEDALGVHKEEGRSVQVRNANRNCRGFGCSVNVSAP